MAGNSQKGRGSGRGGSTQKKQKRTGNKGNMNKGSSMPTQKQNLVGGKGKGKGKGNRRRTPQKGGGIAATETPGDGYDSDDIDTEGLEDYAAHSSFLHDMNSDQLEGTKVLKANKKKRKRHDASDSETSAPQLHADDSGGEELDYERAPRKQEAWAKEVAEAQEVDALPVRGADGKWVVPKRVSTKDEQKQARKDAQEQKQKRKQEIRAQRKRQVAGEQEEALLSDAEEFKIGSSGHEEEADNGDEKSSNRSATSTYHRTDLAGLQDWENQQQSLAAAQAAIGSVCVSIIEDPDENGHRLAELHDLYPTNFAHMASNPAYLSYQAR